MVVPTKELAKQITIESRKVGYGTGIRIKLLKKGMKLEQNHDELGIGELGGNEPSVTADVIVSTPLRVLDDFKKSDEEPLVLPTVRNLVLDEADILLDPQSRQQTIAIWTVRINESLRVSLWSATVGSNIEQITRTTTNPGQNPREQAIVRKSLLRHLFVL